jgi:hypothetical protein
VSRSVLSAGLVLAATLGISMPAAAATVKTKAVTMTVTLVPNDRYVRWGNGVKLTGRAGYGKTGNTGVVDIDFSTTPWHGTPGTAPYVRHVSTAVAGGTRGPVRPAARRPPP